jgi:hypothetical protein
MGPAGPKARLAGSAALAARDPCCSGLNADYSTPFAYRRKTFRPSSERSKQKAAGESISPTARWLSQNLARPAGFEPTTPWFVAKYSIQLSYGRELRIIAKSPFFLADRPFRRA